LYWAGIGLDLFTTPYGVVDDGMFPGPLSISDAVVALVRIVTEPIHLSLSGTPNLSALLNKRDYKYVPCLKYPSLSAVEHAICHLASRWRQRRGVGRATKAFDFYLFLFLVIRYLNREV
jgi:hypothetical protein